MFRRSWLILLLLLQSGLASLAASELLPVWYAEGPGDRQFSSPGGDIPFNPASIVKVATSLWALETLGPAQRFETTFAVRGSLDRATGVLDGDLLVSGTGDPDFHVENAYLVARALNDLGVRQITGSLLVDELFWIGWEGGSEGRTRNPVTRAAEMATRLRDALDPSRWDRAGRASIEQFVARRGWHAEPTPRVVVLGATGQLTSRDGQRLLVTHRSNSLLQILKRFNSYSNNDIERLETSLGSPAELAAFLAKRWKVDGATLQITSLSGLGANELSPRLVVRLLQDLKATSERLGFGVQDILPMTGCDPGTLEKFSVLNDSRYTKALVAKTGTLVATGGGVSVLAGYLGTGRGELIFCVAVPRSGHDVIAARLLEERWLTGLSDTQLEGPVPAECGAPVIHSDRFASIVVAEPAISD